MLDSAAPGFMVILEVVYSPFFVQSPVSTCGGFSGQSSSRVCRQAGNIVCLNFSREALVPGTIFSHCAWCSFFKDSVNCSRVMASSGSLPSGKTCKSASGCFWQDASLSEAGSGLCNSHLPNQP